MQTNWAALERDNQAHRIEQLERDLAARDAELAAFKADTVQGFLKVGAELFELKQRAEAAEQRAQAWRRLTHEAENVALAALASFKITQRVDDYPESHWAHKAERIRVTRAAIEKARDA